MKMPECRECGRFGGDFHERLPPCPYRSDLNSIVEEHHCVYHGQVITRYEVFWSDPIVPIFRGTNWNDVKKEAANINDNEHIVVAAETIEFDEHLGKLVQKHEEFLMNNLMEKVF